MKKIFLTALIILALIWLLLMFGKIPDVVENQAELSWEMGNDAKSYKIYWGENPRSSDCPPGGYENSEDVGMVKSYRIENLETGKTYYFSVTAIGEGGKESCFSPETHKEFSPGIRSIWKKFF